MSEIQLINISDIHVPERLREVDEEAAINISASIVEHGLIQPITVRKTPNGKGKFTLVAGAHRLRAVEICEDHQIEALVTKADADEAILLEITENLFRNDLTKMDRAIFVQSYRDVWEKKHGEIKRGGDQTVNMTVCLTDIVSEEAKQGFAATCAERMGLSVSAVERASRIASSLSPEIRKVIKGTPIEDNQSELLNLAKMEPKKQKQLAKGLAENDFDLKKTIAILDGTLGKKPDPQIVLLSRLIDTFERANPQTRKKFFVHLKKQQEKQDEKQD